MARLARVVISGLPHHVTQRGNRRQQTFFCEEDHAAYVEPMAQWCRERRVDIWGYCLMPNHVHLIAVPQSEDGLRRAIGEAHRRYTRRINFRERWRGGPSRLPRFCLTHTIEQSNLVTRRLVRAITAGPQSIFVVPPIPGACRCGAARS